jgi:hypothetical protein
MGLFGKRKQEKDQIAGLMGSIAHDVELAQQVAAKEMANTGISADQRDVAMQAAMAPGAMDQMLATRERMMRLTTHGVETPATLSGVSVGATSALSSGPEVTFDWSVEPPGAAPYAARSVDTVHPSVVPGLVAGARCTVRVDPDNPQSVMFWGTAEPVPGAPVAPPAAPAADERVARLTKLQDLRAQGLITEDEFAQRKAQILSGD